MAPQLVDGEFDGIGSNVDYGDEEAKQSGGVEEKPARQLVDVESSESGGQAASNGTEGDGCHQ